MISNDEIRLLSGKHVKSTGGEKLGKVADVYESTDGARGTFVTVHTGLFSHPSFVPLAEAALDGDDLVVPYGKELVKDAPRTKDDEELSAEEEDRLAAHYGLTPSSTAEAEQAGLTLSEERLHVTTETRQAGVARLRKRIATETQSVTVPVAHDEVRIERTPIADTGEDVGPLSEEEHEIVLTEQVPVVTKETVPVEHVTLAAETVLEDATVTADMSKEVLEVSEADAR